MTLLQRLAGYVGGQAPVAARVRPASSVHAQMPLGVSRDNDEPIATSVFAPLAAQSRGASPVVTAPTPHLRQQDVSPAHQRIEIAHEYSPQAAPASPLRTPSNISHEARAPESPRPGTDFTARAPRPLLDDAPTTNAPPTIKPATPQQPALTIAAGDSRSEPTEVHVHIGRIEVIAAPEPQGSKKSRSAPARNTLPLAEYLSRRRPA